MREVYLDLDVLLKNINSLLFFRHKLHGGKKIAVKPLSYTAEAFKTFP